MKVINLNVMPLLLISASLALLSCRVMADEDQQPLLSSFHEYGITKCDDLILERTKLSTNWNFFISSHPGNIDKVIKEVSVIQVFGSKGDTVKTSDTYIQTNARCFVNNRSIITNSGACKDNVDLNFWYVSKKMDDKDYTQYKNKGGVEMLAKEIEVGGFKACIKETEMRNSAPISIKNNAKRN